MGALWRILAPPIMTIIPFSSETLHTIAMVKLRNRCHYVPGYRRLLKMMYKSNRNPNTVFGIDFENPVGLAAGMDKKGENIPNWECLGFGWIEIGGITFHQQDGNPKPRMFRSNKHRALINRMGFNNLGSEEMRLKLKNLRDKNRWANVPVAINLGKSKITPNDEAEIDYVGTIERLWEYADFFVVNVSSPNTPNLRDLQSGNQLERILVACNEANSNQSETHGKPLKPILVKISPDLSDDQIGIVADTALMNQCGGIIATNTTTDRPSIGKVMNQEGGLSGKPLRKRSTDVIHRLYSHTGGKIPIIGVGGIFDAESAWEKIAAGASLLQLYSALIFEGPSVNKSINKGLILKMNEFGYDSLADAVGHAHRYDS